MTQGSVGWTCPKCGVIISPYQETCIACKPPIKTYSGTFSLGDITYSGLGTITLGGAFASGTIYTTPLKSDAQKLAEAVAARDKAERRARKYSEWADKIITFYEQLNDLTQELDDLTDEPDEIENE